MEVAGLEYIQWREDRGTPHKPSCALVPSVEVWHVATPEVSSRFDDRPTTARSSLVVPCRTFPYNSLPPGVERRSAESVESPYVQKRGCFLTCDRAHKRTTQCHRRACETRNHVGRGGRAVEMAWDWHDGLA